MREIVFFVVGKPEHGLSTEKIRQIVWWRNIKSAHVSQYQVRKFRTCILGSSDFTS